MKITTLVLQLTISYRHNGTSIEELEQNLEDIPDYAANNGMFTGNTKATVEEWKTEILEVKR